MRAIINSSPLGYKILLGKIPLLSFMGSNALFSKVCFQNQPLFIGTQKPSFPWNQTISPHLGKHPWDCWWVSLKRSHPAWRTFKWPRRAVLSPHPKKHQQWRGRSIPEAQPEAQESCRWAGATEESPEIKLTQLLFPFKIKKMKTICKIHFFFFFFFLGGWVLQYNPPKKLIWKRKVTSTKNPAGFINPHVQSWGLFLTN